MPSISSVSGRSSGYPGGCVISVGPSIIDGFASLLLRVSQPAFIPLHASGILHAGTSDTPLTHPELAAIHSCLALVRDKRRGERAREHEPATVTPRMKRWGFPLLTPAYVLGLRGFMVSLWFLVDQAGRTRTPNSAVRRT